MASATIVHDTSEAVDLCPVYGLYLKPITKMTISVALPQLKQPGKSISNWEVMERLKGMVHSHQFSTLRISKSTMDFIRFEGEVENKSLVKSFLACLDGKTIKLSGFSDILKVRAAEFKVDFPSRHDWDSFFRDAKDMNETLPGERPDTVHLEGLPCKWFALKDSGSEKPSEEVLVRVFEKFGAIRNVDIPMLDPYREEMTGRNFHTFSFGGHLNFEAYVQYCEYAGFIQAMSALRGMKLMYKGEDGKAVACNIKVSFDSTKHLSDASIKKRQLERQKLQELEQQREEQKRREKEAEERQRAEERKQKELEELERERRREEKLRKREQKQRDRELRRNQKRLEKLQAEEQRRLQEKIRLEERKLLLAQRNLQSIRLIAELLSRAKVLEPAAVLTRAHWGHAAARAWARCRWSRKDWASHGGGPAVQGLLGLCVVPDVRLGERGWGGAAREHHLPAGGWVARAQRRSSYRVPGLSWPSSHWDMLARLGQVTRPGAQGTGRGRGPPQSPAGRVPAPRPWCGRPCPCRVDDSSGPRASLCPLQASPVTPVSWARGRGQTCTQAATRPCGVGRPHNLLSACSVDKAPGRTMAGALRLVAAQFLFHGRQGAGAGAEGAGPAAAAAGGAAAPAGGGAAARGGGEGARPGAAAEGEAAAPAPAEHPAEQEGGRPPGAGGPGRRARGPAAARAGHPADRVGRLSACRLSASARGPGGPQCPQGDPATARGGVCAHQRERERHRGRAVQGPAALSSGRARGRLPGEALPRGTLLHPGQQPAAQGHAPRLRAERAAEGHALGARQVQPGAQQEPGPRGRGPGQRGQAAAGAQPASAGG
ncbi:A-kinase anchor protein 17A isoform X1 [Artibeus jamaicensis]|uniref:A-kinase anchor protein 17A isoform X1 n=1 Tax=Artibeus jamaicensis TaxID=9417 RepID=UPI00235B03F9|nr:A-kinase anchor protein 17A isoform X1 [Artibeus jamaicensis]XP_053529411.1 A-kinase anchor protein 17A isoform X1 [Artibeus jamaicensis]XP_053529412.1 A-kinase anchor protein 17A isoform X1 [Artibeus jamaicensis]